VKAIGLEGFNALSDRQRMHLLFEVCSSTIWARRVVAGSPFRDPEALYDHPRIGASVSAAHSPSSAREQARVADAGEAVKVALAAKNREYEDRFGYVYLVCASGRSADELLDILTDRLDNDPETERRVMRNELSKINRLRLERLLSEPT